MIGTKRSSPDTHDDSEASTPRRPSKVAKTKNPQKSHKSDKKRGGKTGAKPSISAEAFNSAALPIHVNITHTPPTIADPETEAKSVASMDPGFIGNVTLIPSVFSTGSFGWKGNKRITVELESSEEDEKEKVQVILSINATVIGSKPPKAAEYDEILEEEGSNSEGQ
ncbi:hypothetical protein H0H92_012033 [Tricholoma furcatifolium]|nr:hypothetical protein H0H92_012033 [Tricholoma furcatifolium]